MTVHVKRATVGALVALATALVLSSCAGEPGAAVVVDGTGIPVSDVTTAYDELRPIYQGIGADSVIGAFIDEPVITQMAEEQGVAPSAEQAEAALVADAQAADPEAQPTFSAPALVVGTYIAGYRALVDASDQATVDKELAERRAELDVEVNPRFGTLGDGNIVSAATPRSWIVQAAPQSDESGDAPSPSPSATP